MLPELRSAPPHRPLAGACAGACRVPRRVPPWAAPGFFLVASGAGGTATTLGIAAFAGMLVSTSGIRKADSPAAWPTGPLWEPERRPAWVVASLAKQ